MVLNGSLAGLVGITAGADTVSVNASILIGLVAGIIVVLSVLAFDRAKIDAKLAGLRAAQPRGIATGGFAQRYMRIPRR